MSFRRLADLRLELLLGDLLLVEDHRVADADLAGAEPLAEPRDLLGRHVRARDRAQHRVLAALDALRDLDLALAGEQRHGAHLAQVHAHGVVRLVEGARGEVELDALLLRLLPELLLGVDDLDAHRTEHREDVVQLVRRADLGGQEVVHLLVEEVALLLAHRDELPDLVVLFLDRKRHCLSSPCSLQPRLPRGPSSAARGASSPRGSASCASPLAPASLFWISAIRALSGCRRSSRTHSSAERRSAGTPSTAISDTARRASSSPSRLEHGGERHRRALARHGLRRAQERRRRAARRHPPRAARRAPARRPRRPAPRARAASARPAAALRRAAGATGRRAAASRHRRRAARPCRAGERPAQLLARRARVERAALARPARATPAARPRSRCARARAARRRGTPPCPAGVATSCARSARRISHSTASGASSSRLR